MAIQKFKIGDLVIGNDAKKYGITKKGWIGKVTRVYNNDKIDVYGDCFGHKQTFTVEAKYFDLYKPDNDKIIITHDGKTTTATMYLGDGTKKVATARCAPEDTFDFKFGANLAMERLIGKNETKVEPIVEWRVVDRKPRVGDYIRLKTDGGYHFSEPGDILKVDEVGGGRVRVYGKNHPRDTNMPNMNWTYLSYEYEVVEKITTTEPKKPEPKPEPPQYYNGKVVCITSDDRLFTVGKIYEIVDGKFIDNSGSERPMTRDRVCKVEDLNTGYFKTWAYRFIPLVEDENKPLTIEELRTMDGKKVWLSSMVDGKENFTNKFCGWHTVDVTHEKLYDATRSSYKFSHCNDDYGFRAYRKPPKT